MEAVFFRTWCITVSVITLSVGSSDKIEAVKYVAMLGGVTISMLDLKRSRGRGFDSLLACCQAVTTQPSIHPG